MGKNTHGEVAAITEVELFILAIHVLG